MALIILCGFLLDENVVTTVGLCRQLRSSTPIFHGPRAALYFISVPSSKDKTLIFFGVAYHAKKTQTYCS